MIIIILKIWAILANWGDYFITIYGIKYHGAKEANPIARWLFKYPLLAFLIKNILVAYLIWNFPTIRLVIYASVIFTFAVINNALVIRRNIWMKKFLKNLPNN